MLFRKAAARKSCSALRCAAQKHGHGSKIKEQLAAHVFKLYDICTEFDVKIQQQIIRNPAGVVEGFQERSGRAPGAKTDGKKPKPANSVPKCNPNRQEMQSKSTKRVSK